MNKQRREELFDVTAILEDAAGRLAEIRGDEEEALDNLPPGLQASSTGDAMQEAIDVLDEFEADIMNVCTKIENYAKPKRKVK